MHIRPAAAGEMAMPISDLSTDADLLSGTMHRLFSHDLPNQVVAMQSLLQMLEMDAGARLGANGSECLSRLQRVGQKISGMARFLKEIERLRSTACHLEEMSLPALVRELRLQLQQQLPDTPLDCVAEGSHRAMTADPRSLAQGLVEILRCFTERWPGCRSCLRLNIEPVTDAAVLVGEVCRPQTEAGPVAAGRPSPTNLNQRLELILAGALLGAGGGRLAEVREEADRSTFRIIVVPQRAAHG